MFEAVVIGASAGGLNAFKTFLPKLEKNFSLPLMLVQHISPQSDNYMTTHLDKLCKIKVKEAEEKETIKKGTAYFSPPNFHMLIEEDKSISFSVENKVNYARPSIDVLFETASYAYKNKLIGIILTGANNDGAAGLKKIQELGGFTIVQDPEEAEVDTMPLSAIKIMKPDKILKLKEIADFLNKIHKNNKRIA
ncbi:MAG: chemotaxis protein CheB [Bacteroidales bacterium]|nr:chemotaxis protein CheB [Bacteroidales bacterium]MCF8388385.1 chemotaxis protein CheB [Bacteroidales bacterium]MCF8396614.1 chemotaxis protein CheB [Bacteroidales bacterium]